MRKRNISFLIRLSDKEYERLQKNVLKTGLSREALIRALLFGYQPKELPPLDYHSLVQELHSIGVNLNQNAAKANAIGHIDRTAFQYEANRMHRAVLDIQAAFTLPEKRCDDGTTAIWDVKDRLNRVIDYAANPEKTVNVSDRFTQTLQQEGNSVTHITFR